MFLVGPYSGADGEQEKCQKIRAFMPKFTSSMKLFVINEGPKKKKAGSEKDNNIPCYLRKNGHFLICIASIYHKNFLYQAIIGS